MQELKKFYVLVHNINTNNVEMKDILPYFRQQWNNKKFIFIKDKELLKKKDIKNREIFKEWVLNTSMHEFHCRCQHEIVVGHWPFGSYQLKENMKDFFNKNPNINFDDYKQNIDFINVILKEMSKIDVHYQLEANIEVLTDILIEEFKLFKRKKSTKEIVD